MAVGGEGGGAWGGWRPGSLLGPEVQPLDPTLYRSPSDRKISGNELSGVWAELWVALAMEGHAAIPTRLFVCACVCVFVFSSSCCASARLSFSWSSVCLSFLSTFLLSEFWSFHSVVIYVFVSPVVLPICSLFRSLHFICLPAS